MTETEIVYENGVPLVPNVHPVFVLQGSDEEMGGQFVEQLVDVYGSYAIERYDREFTDEEEIAVEKYSDYLREFTPEFVELLVGMAQGAQKMGFSLEYKHFLADFCNTMGAFGPVRLPVYPAETKANEPISKECSGFAAWGSATKNGSLICGGSADHVVEFTNIVVCFPDTGNNMIFRMPLDNVSLGMFPGMNNKGVAYAHHGSGILAEEEKSYGVAGCAQVFHTLRFANTAEEALEIQSSYPLGTRADGLWVDVYGNAGVLECRAPKTIRRSGDCGEKDFLHATNTVLAKNLGPYITNYCDWPVSYVEHGGWLKDDLDSERRNLHMWNALHNYHGSIDLEFAKMLWRMTGPKPEYDTLEEAERGLYETKGEGWLPYVGNLSNVTVAFAEPDNGNNGKYHVCTGEAGRKLEPLSDEWYFFDSKQLYSFFELDLKKNPEEVVFAAKTKCDYDLFYGNRSLSKLSVHDQEFFPLTKMFAKASKEYQKGDFFFNEAKCVAGGKKIRFFAKALRCYTRCQAFALHVHESINPAPVLPEEMNLPEWLGEWGEWDWGPKSSISN